MEIIRSHQNAMVKNYQKLQTSKGRKKAEAYMIEGEHLVEEAIQSNISIHRLVVSEDMIHLYEKWTKSYPTMFVSKEVFEKLSMTQTNQGILAIVKLEKKTLVEVPQGRYLLADAVQDPGNLGTIIRTADAAGFDAVVLGEGCVDLYNDKVVRSMQGSQFHVAIYHENLMDVYGKLKENDIPIAVTALHRDAKDFKWLTGRESVAIVVGNEGNGVREELIESADHVIQIPMFGQAESLNVAIATGILMYQTRI